VSGAPLPPVRVERALALLPDLEVLAPLRALLVASARPDERSMWSSSGPYLTLGKRGVDPDELRRGMPLVFHQSAEHLQALCRAYVEALECQQASDAAGVVAALVRGGRLEERVGRLAQARAWYDVALGVAEGLQDRRPEVETLCLVGRLCVELGRYPEGARQFQRALALAEAEFDQSGAVAACEGLGDAAQAQGEWGGAQAWYARGLRLAEASGDPTRIGRLERRLGALARQQGDLSGAGEHLRRARESFEAAEAASEMAATLNTQGRLDAQLGRDAAAVAAYREAFAWAQRADRDPALELSIRLNLAELHLGMDRLLEAEEELRRAEQAAIDGNLTARLIDVYTLMGRLRGQQQDETGFVFFEQAIELARAAERSAAHEAQVYFEYGVFKRGLGQQEEARAYLERAREIFQSLGEAVRRERVEAELERVSA
jgi:tetratricopeptide (TPR) repeat protein